MGEAKQIPAPAGPKAEAKAIPAATPTAPRAAGGNGGFSNARGARDNGSNDRNGRGNSNNRGHDRDTRNNRNDRSRGPAPKSTSPPSDSGARRPAIRTYVGSGSRPMTGPGQDAASLWASAGVKTYNYQDK